MSSPPQPPDAPHTGTGPEWQPARDVPPVVRTPVGRFAVVVTNLAKAAGVVFGSIEAVGPARPPAVLFWVALFLGAQALEDLLTRVIDRTMGK